MELPSSPAKGQASAEKALLDKAVALLRKRPAPPASSSERSLKKRAMEERRRIVEANYDRLGHASELASRFTAEAQATAQLQHPNIVPVHDVGVLPDGRPFYTMRVVTGQDLHTLIDGLHAVSTRARWGTPEDGATFLDLCDAFHQVCEAVAWAHSRGVLHRDLKPENVMVGDYGQVLVVDWGLAKVVGSTSHDLPEISTARSSRPDLVTRYGRVSGTPGFMAPEQARGENDLVGPRADVFALGGILFTLLSGRAPAPDEEPATALAGFPRVDATLRELCVHAMELDPADRPADARALAERFGAWRRGAQEEAQQSAAADEADAAYQALPDDLRAALPPFLVRLVGPDGDARPTSAWAAPPAILDALERARIVAREGEEARLVDASFPRTWSRLRGWVEADPERHIQLHLLIEATRAWEAAGRPAGLLWTERAAVDQAQRVLTARTEEEGAFLDASAAALERRRRSRRALVTAVLLVVLGAAVFSSLQWRSAVQARDSAEAARLAAEARALLAQSQERVLEGTPLAAAVSLQGAALLTADPDDREDALTQARALAAAAQGSSAVLGRLAQPVRSLAWSPSGAAVITGDSAGAVTVWSTDLLTPRYTVDLGSAVKVLRWSPRGDTFAAADIQGVVRVFAADDGALLATLPVDQGWRPSLRYLPDGRLVSATTDGDVVLVDPATGDILQTLEGHSHYVFGADLHPEGQLLATASVDQTLRLWDLRTGAERHRIGHDLQLLLARFASGGARVVTMATEGPVAWLWDTETGAAVATLQGHQNMISDLEVSPDGDRIATASKDGTTRLWRAADGALLHTLAASGGLDWSPTGRLLAIGGSDGRTRIFDGITGARMAELPAHAARVYSLAWDPRGERVLTGDADGGVRISAPQVAGVQTTDLCDTGILDWGLSPDGRTLAVTSSRRRACVAAIDGEGDAEVLPGEATWLFWSPTGETLMKGINSANTVGAWAWNPGGGPPRPLEESAGLRSGIDFDSTGGTFYFVSHDYRIRGIDAGTGAPKTALRTGKRPLLSEIRGRRALNWNHDHTTEVWDLDTEQRLLADDDTDREGRAMALGPRGAWIAWETARGKVSRHDLPAQPTEGSAAIWETELGAVVQWLSIDPSGRTVAAILNDNSVALLDAETGAVRSRLRSSAAMNAVRFGATGDRVAMWSAEGDLDVHRTADGTLLLRISAGDAGGVVAGTILASGELLTISQDGAARRWPIQDPPPVPGALTNQRICRDGALQAVTPWPEPEPIWAPDGMCGAP